MPEEALAHWRKARERGAAAHDEWRRSCARTRQAHPDRAKEFERRLAGRSARRAGRRRSRRSRRTTATSRAARRPDRCSTRSWTKCPSWWADRPTSRRRTTRSRRRSRTSRPTTTRALRALRHSRARHGRDHERHGAHGGVIPYGGTFLIFSDYMRPSRSVSRRS